MRIRQKAEAQVLYVAEQAASSSVRKFALQLWRWPSKVIQALSLPHRLYQPDSYVVEAIGQERLERVRLQTPKESLKLSVIDSRADWLSPEYSIRAVNGLSN